MAMTSVRLPSSVLRKPDAWIGLCRALRGTPSHKHCASWNRYLHLSSTKLNASNYKTFFHNIFSLRLSGLLISQEYIFPFSIRLKSNVSSKKSTKKTLQKVEDEGDSDEESEHHEMSEQEEEPEDDPSSFRYDVTLKTGLDIGRNKVEDAFYKGELRLNGEKLWKKSRTVKMGDTLDLLIGEDREAETETVMRILLEKVGVTAVAKVKIALKKFSYQKKKKKQASRKICSPMTV
uniref:Mitochondrial transcription rescue factor 1 C-terminal domain-containing protein n=1 Tax=Monodon monoceros TaxID=40151 RepID=A0A8C6CKW3_MONMO